MDRRVFWSVFAALCAFALLSLFVVASLNYRASQIRDEQLASIQAQAQANEEAFRNRLRSQQLLQQQQSYLEVARRTLRTDERCLGGTVIKIVGTSYTQETNGPYASVKCAGRVADR